MNVGRQSLFVFGFVVGGLVLNVDRDCKQILKEIQSLFVTGTNFCQGWGGLGGSPHSLFVSVFMVGGLVMIRD